MLEDSSRRRVRICSVRTCSSARKAWGERGRSELTTVRLRRPMEGKGVAPDVVAYSTAIKACGDGWQWELAIVLPQSSVSWPPEGMERWLF